MSLGLPFNPLSSPKNNSITLNVDYTISSNSLFIYDDRFMNLMGGTWSEFFDQKISLMRKCNPDESLFTRVSRQANDVLDVSKC